MPCLVCGHGEVPVGLDVGAHPVATCFTSSIEEDTALPIHELRLAQCTNCATNQLETPVPYKSLVAPHDWIFSREPEDHLDDMVNMIVDATGLKPPAVVGAVTYKDDTTIHRFAERGYETWRLELDTDLDIEDHSASVETVQFKVRPGPMATVANRRGVADILIIRHVIEHSEDLGGFLLGMRELVKPGGFLIIELPDCSTSLKLRDYAMIWEEHSLYFTAETFSQVPQLGGFEIVREEVYPLPFENCLTFVCRRIEDISDAFVVAKEARKQMDLLANYAADHQPATVALNDAFAAEVAKGGKIALFGAGHLAAAFVNFHDLGDQISFVVDDTPQKQGLYLPGTGLPIVPSSRLVECGVTLCLLALSISTEPKIIENNAEFLATGGRFASILRSSQRSVFANLPQA